MALSYSYWLCLRNTATDSVSEQMLAKETRRTAWHCIYDRCMMRVWCRSVSVARSMCLSRCKFWRRVKLWCTRCQMTPPQCAYRFNANNPTRDCVTIHMPPAPRNDCVRPKHLIGLTTDAVVEVAARIVHGPHSINLDVGFSHSRERWYNFPPVLYQLKQSSNNNNNNNTISVIQYI